MSKRKVSGMMLIVLLASIIILALTRASLNNERSITFTTLQTSLINSLYDKTVTLPVYDSIDLAYDPDRNVLWMGDCYTHGLSEIDANTMNVLANITFPLATANSYRVAYDGKWVWVTTSGVTPAPAFVFKVNPTTLAYTNYTAPNDAGHMYANALCVTYNSTGKEYVWVGMGSNSTNYQAYLYRFDPTTFPNNPTIINLRNTTASWYSTQVRELVFDGTQLWAGGDGGRVFRININTMTFGLATTFPGISIFSGTWDGSYLWWGTNNGKVIKMNPTSYASKTMTLELAIRLIHRWAYDGNGYLWTFDYTSGHVYIINCLTMAYTIWPITYLSPHAILFDGQYIWIADNCTESAPPALARLSRYCLHDPGSQQFEEGLTSAFAANVTGTVTVTITFNKAFLAPPTVTVGLNAISDSNAVIVNVQAMNVTATGFVCSARLIAAGGTNATAKFSWIATSRYADLP